ncbi:MAG TPA: hypothetical protein DHW14_02720 [Clostridiales bacterium]|nr:hypothetical protein [Clostridiales bacterium]
MFGGGGPSLADLVGLPLPAASRRVEEAGLSVRVVWTRPPWRGQGGGQGRVVRLREPEPGVVELTCAWEVYERSAGKADADQETRR